MHSRLIGALKDPGNYPHPVERVELIETHISWVLLAGEYAYKIKKPVDLGFLDFSTPARRRFYCREEIRLNRPTAPKLYLDVVAITGTPERPRFAEPECDDPAAVEYAVRMRRFNAGNGFDRLLAEGRLKSGHIAELGEQLARLHEIADVAPAESRFGKPDQVAKPMRDNVSTLDRLLIATEDRNDLARLSDWTEQACGELERVFRQRHETGFVRECHGDAHLGNVTLFEGHATLFDCIEFSEELRWIDVFNDVAFSVMDLRDRGAGEFAWLLLDRYLTRTGDFDGLAVLKVYAVYRALVRAKVTGLHANDVEEATERERLEHGVREYLALAGKLSSETRPAIAITTGLSGSGKSWLAERLLQLQGMIRLRSDVERKRIHGLAPGDTSRSGLGRDLYGESATRATYDELLRRTGQIVEAGLPVLVDAAFLRRFERDRFRDLAERMSIPFAILACEADPDTLRQRVRKRAERGRDASEADLAVLEHQLHHRDAPAGEEVPFVVDIDTTTPEALLEMQNGIAERGFDPIGQTREPGASPLGNL